MTILSETLVPLSSGDEKVNIEILDSIWEAHEISATNNQSASKTVALVCAQGSGSFIHSLCGGLMTVGETHGPIGRARQALLTLDRATAKEYAGRGIKIPGFGNSFHKNDVDPAWKKVLTILEMVYPSHFSKLSEIKSGLHAAGKRVYPNPAGICACACNAMDLPFGVEEGLFVLPRISVLWKQFLTTKETS